MTHLPHVTQETPISFDIDLADGSKIRTVGDIEAYLTNLSDEQSENDHWGVAAQMFDNVIHEPAYLPAVTMAFQVAAAMDGLLAGMPGRPNSDESPP